MTIPNAETGEMAPQRTPALPSVLAQLADSLAEHGVRFGASPMRDVSAVLSFLQTVGVSVDDACATAAIAVMLLPPEDACRFVAGLGVPPGLVPNVIPSVIGIDDQLVQIINKGSRTEAIVAASMLFALFKDAARRGDNSRIGVCQ